MEAGKRITVALTHYNRFGLLLEAVCHVLDDPRIGEIVISDDVSTDGSYERLRAHFNGVGKVRIYRNAKNLDCYRNKAAAVQRATNPWVILFDSDNVLPAAFLDTIYSLPEWNPDVVYCPDFAEPRFDYSPWAGTMIDRHNVAGYMGVSPVGHPPWQRRRHRPPENPNKAVGNMAEFRTALNTCNYFVHRDNYLKVWDGTVDPVTADSMFQVYNWLASGRKMFFVPGLRYYHRVHEDSHYKLNYKRTNGFGKVVEERIRQLK